MSEVLRAEWPALVYDDWAETCETLRLWTQVAGKVRMALTPPVNHWWHVTLYAGARGLTTSPIPYRERSFEIVFDFVGHEAQVVCSDGALERIALEPMAVADFHAGLMRALEKLGIEVRIWTVPCETADRTPFEADRQHAAYDREAVERFWKVLSQVDRIMKAFRGRFLGKASPVQFFWGSFDLAVTRFSGRMAPPHPGSEILPASVSREAYSHEVSSCGFWPGAPGVDALFYAYAYPEPNGFRDALIRSRVARYDEALGEYVLPYAQMREAVSPEFALLNFLQTTYEAAAEFGNWPRDALERHAPRKDPP